MGNYEQLKQAVADVIKSNGNQEITGAILQNALLTIISTIGTDATFAGIATPTTKPGTPDQNVFYIASENGTYSNFNGVVLSNEVSVLSNNNGNWVKTNTGLATQQQFSELDKKIIKVEFTDNEKINEYIKEMYIDMAVVDKEKLNSMSKLQITGNNTSGNKFVRFTDSSYSASYFFIILNSLSGNFDLTKCNNTVYYKEGIYIVFNNLDNIYVAENFQTLNKTPLYVNSRISSYINDWQYIEHQAETTDTYEVDINVSNKPKLINFADCAICSKITITYNNGSKDYLYQPFKDYYLNNLGANKITFTIAQIGILKIQIRNIDFVDFNSIQNEYFKRHILNLIINRNVISNAVIFIYRLYKPVEDGTKVRFQSFFRTEEGSNIKQIASDEFEYDSLDFLSLEEYGYKIDVNIKEIPITDKFGKYMTCRLSTSNYERDNEVFNKPNYYPANVLQQNYYDDMQTEKKGQMLRTDNIVWNQGNIGIFGTDNKNLGFNYIGDDTCNTRYFYFYWLDVQKEAGSYDFTPIEKYLISCYTKKQRTALRLFPSCISENYETFESYRISFPSYVAELMKNNEGQSAIYTDRNGNNHLLLDVNLDVVYAEYEKLLQAFGSWLNTTVVDAENNVYAKDLILFIDFGFLGPWGEGAWGNLALTTNVENINRYVQAFLTNVPDIQINIGLSFNKGYKYFERNKFFIDSKELYNNAVYLGIFIDNIGARNPDIFDKNRYIALNTTFYDLLRKYVERGDFITGEFAMWTNNAYWGGNCGLWAYDLFKLTKQPFVRAHNITITPPNAASILLRNISGQSYYVINNILSCVGFRYVLSVLRGDINDSKLSIEWELANIGLNKCYFDIYELYYRIKKNTGDIQDVKIEYDLKTLMPIAEQEPLLFAIGNGKYFKYETEIDETFESISLIVKDKKGIQNPLYLSNYERQEDGSYLLYSVVE